MAGVQESGASLAVNGRSPTEIRAASCRETSSTCSGCGWPADATFPEEDDRGAVGAPVAIVSQALAVSAFGSVAEAPWQADRAQQPAVLDYRRRTGGIRRHLQHRRRRCLGHRCDLGLSQSREALSVHDARPTACSISSSSAPRRTATFVEVESELKVLARQLADSHPTRTASSRGGAACVSRARVACL